MTVIGIFLGVIAISSLVNIFQQAMILNGAKNRNREMGAKITQLEAENQIMVKQIEYATSSANLERKVREYMGLGGLSDHWLLVDLGGTNPVGPEEIPESGTKINLMQWWELFVR